MESIWNSNIMEYIIAVIYGRSAFLVIEVNGYIIKEEYMTVISPLPNFDVKDFHCQYTVFSACIMSLKLHCYGYNHFFRQQFLF